MDAISSMASALQRCDGARAEQWKRVEIDDLARTPQTRKAAKSEVYRCEGCIVQVLPVFPRERGSDLKKPRCAHFRTWPGLVHEASCRPQQAAVTAASTTPAVVPARTWRYPVPTVMIEAHLKAPGRGRVDATGDDESASQARGRGYIGRTGGSTHAPSVTRVQSIERLVGAWRARPDIGPMPLQVPGCRATTYGGVFREITRELATQLPSWTDTYIYWSGTARVQQDKRGGGFRIATDVETEKHKSLGFLIPDQYSASRLPGVAKRLLDQAVKTPGSPVSVYVLGRLKYDRERHAFLVRPESGRHVWIAPD